MDSVPQDVLKLLGPNEQVQLFIKQKIYHPKINVDSVVLTNERIILRHPHAMGLRQDYTDFSYQDVANAVLDKGIMRSTVKCVLRFGGDPLALNDLPNDEAERAYGIIRENLVRYQTPWTAGMAPPMMAAFQQRGAAIATQMCRKCGAQVRVGARFCGACGTQL